MYFISKTHAAGYTDVFFGYELTGICPSELGGSIIEAVMLMARFIQSLYAPVLDTAFELVALTNPAVGSGPRLALRVRVSSHNGAAALVIAQEVAQGLSSSLALWERLRWAPLDEAAYSKFFVGYAPCHLWEIGRRAELLELAPGLSTQASGRHGLAVYPFLPSPDPIARLMRTLNQRRENLRVSIAISPARFTERELKYIDAQKKAFTKDADSAEDLELAALSSLAVLGTAARAELMKESAFLLRVYAASDMPVPGITINSLASSLAAQAVPSEHMGGYKIQPLVEAEEKLLAASNLDSLRFALPPFQAGSPWGRLPMIVTATEAAGMFRFPASHCPGLERFRRPAPYSGRVVAAGTLIGSAAGFGADRHEVRLSPDARLRHVYICGQTGVGKTTLMFAMAMQDILENNGLCLLDPHGDLIPRIIANLPESRRKDVIVFDCSLADPGLTFNLLEHSSDGERDRIVEHFLEMFNLLFDHNTMGPMFEMYFRSALSLVMCDPEATLADFMRFFYSKEYREQCIKLCKDPFVVGAWQGIVAAAGGDLRLENVAPYIVAKLTPFLYNKQIRGILSSKTSSLNFDEAIRKRRIILVNTAKGTVGNLASTFIGMIFTQKILRAAMKPANKVQNGSNFYLYADEFQNLATPGFGELLSEARKFGLGAVLAHQFLGQLPPAVLSAALGNAGNLLCMRVGPADATLLSEYFQPAFSKSDLLTLPVGAAAASILSEGEKPMPFLLSTPNGMASAPATTVSQELERTEAIPVVVAKRPVRAPRGALRDLQPNPKWLWSKSE